MLNNPLLADNIKNIFDSFESAYIVITIMAVIIVAIYHFFMNRSQRLQMKNDRFVKCSSDIYLDNETAQIAAAIQLREFLKDKDYKNSALNLVVSLLRILPTGSLQKTLSDSLSSLKSADGREFQKVNMNGMLIKSQPYIQYQIKNKTRHYPLISLKKADFYESEISDASINGINADGAIFWGCVMARSAFHDCSLVNANFCNTNLKGVKFYDCNLEHACFMDARNLSSATKVVCIGIDSKGNKKNKKFPLLDYLDKDGYYSEDNINLKPEEKYQEKPAERKIYISRLGLMDAIQQSHYNDIISFVQNHYHVKPILIERSDYKGNGQVDTIMEKMFDCSGVLVVDFSYLTVGTGVIHKNIDNEKIFAKGIINKFINSGGAQRLKGAETNFSSPWLQIETALAIWHKIPCMIIREKDVFANGVFDPVVLNSDKKRIFSFEYQESLDEQMPLFDAWIEQVDAFENNR